MQKGRVETLPTLKIGTLFKDKANTLFWWGSEGNGVSEISSS
mgnify:CR=1 FL=1